MSAAPPGVPFFFLDDKLCIYQEPKGSWLKRQAYKVGFSYNRWKARRIMRSSTRPFDPKGFTGMITSDRRGMPQLRRFPYAYADLYRLRDACITWRSCILALITHSLRPGFEWEQEYLARCPECGTEYEKLDDDGKCDRCGAVLEEPDPSEYEEADRIFQRINSNKQTLRDLLHTVNEDVETVDECYVIKLKSYIHKKGEIFETEWAPWTVPWRTVPGKVRRWQRVIRSR